MLNPGRASHMSLPLTGSRQTQLSSSPGRELRGASERALRQLQDCAVSVLDGARVRVSYTAALARGMQTLRLHPHPIIDRPA